MNHETRIKLVLIHLLALLPALPAAGADWTYGYADDFSTDKAQTETYSRSMFWAGDANPLPESYLQYQGVGVARALVFMGYKDQPAALAYCFPIGTQARRIITGTIQFDVSFPCNVDVSQFPPGELLYSVSSDGMVWSAQESLGAGHHQIPLTSTVGRCYVRFTGTRAAIDNVRVSLSSASATIRVPANYRTIQQAIDAAGTGDVIEVAAGTYTGAGNWDIDFRGKQIVVRSASGPESTIIDCGKPAASTGRGRRGFYFHQGETADSVLAGFTIRGGRIYGAQVPADLSSWTPNASYPVGGGIYCEFSSPSIVNCIIEDCGAELGGGIGCVGGEPAIVDCTIKSCLAGGLGSVASGGRGAGIALVACDNARIVNCVIRGNTGYYNSRGAGIYVLHGAAVIGGCTLSGNVAPGSLRGSGAYCGGDATDVTFKNCIVSANQADAGAGILVERSTDATPSVVAFGRPCLVSITNCTIAQNRLAYAFGGTGAGGVDSSGADITILNSILWYNDGTPVAITGAASWSPVTYSNVQHGYPGQGNIAADPLFAATATPDYHLRSIGGRHNPQTGAWVGDGVNSPCIDAGDPQMPVLDEPSPNGGRIDMGAYGGTIEASKSANRQILHVDVRTGHDTYDGSSKTRAFATIKKAVDKARDGDAIFVWPGMYREEITFRGKAIIMQSAADAAVITAPSSHAFSFYGAESSRSILANFVITGCGESGIYCDGASPTLKNLTIVKNPIGVEGFGGADPSIINCIIWENASAALFQSQAQYSCIEPTPHDVKMGNIAWGIGNIDTDPLFADSKNGDYHLRSQYGRYVPQNGTWVLDGTTSPCIDAGDPEEYPRDERMPNGSRINMGACGGTGYASMSDGPVCP